LSYDEILYEIEDGILTITLNRPEQMNTFTATMTREMYDAIERADADDNVRVIIVTGAGKAFCAGADLSAGLDGFDLSGGENASGSEAGRDYSGRLCLRMFDCKKPMIAAINGAAVGFGITMCLPMDIRICSEKSKIGFVFTQRGIIAEGCSNWFLPRLVGPSQALEWIFSGRVFGAEEAVEGGLVKKAVPPDQVLRAARVLAVEIAQAAPVAVALSRQMLYRMMTESHPMASNIVESAALPFTVHSADAREGVDSFIEKRPAKFSMRPSKDMPDFYPWWKNPKFKPIK